MLGKAQRHNEKGIDGDGWTHKPQRNGDGCSISRRNKSESHEPLGLAQSKKMVNPQD
jgi:hypothetical protein